MLEDDIKKIKNKIDLFEYLLNVEDKSGGLKKQDSIKKNYPEIFNEMEKCEFPENYSFTQKLWHFLQDDFTIHRCECGNELHFIDFKKGYRTYCSKDCPCVLEHNKETLKKAQKESNSIESRKKAVDTIRKKNGGNFWSEENLEKIRRPYKDNVERCEKLRKSYLENKEKRNEKIKNTIKENIRKFKDFSNKTTGCSSKVEIEFYGYLVELFGFENIEPQYFDKISYPFSCDFYIRNVNLFIEIQGNWTHGRHPFNPADENDVETLDFWKSKDNDYYDNAVYTWTDLDVRKRKLAEENGLNYLEIFSSNIDECISIFENYITNIVVGYCLTQKLPGNSRWPENHPIWDCWVGGKISPRDAWSNEIYLKKAVRNIISVCKSNLDFKIAHINEFLKCKIENNRMTFSTDRFLRQIQDRFTIAKIAPKVTALSKDTMKAIIDESGIDLTPGVFIPMAGFGGIYKAVKMWGDEHGKDIECECYDMNERFCKWYGWKKRNVLSKKIKTDKVCLCCPPFGRKFEHWDGTPDDMSDIPFVEWYRLIKEYVKAPAYIIIGPEINGENGSIKGLDKNENRINGLFSKKYGIMLWTDEMIEKNIHK